MRFITLLTKATGLVVLWVAVTFVEVGVKAVLAVAMWCNRYQQAIKQRAVSKRMAEDRVLMRKWADADRRAPPLPPPPESDTGVEVKEGGWPPPWLTK